MGLRAPVRAHPSEILALDEHSFPTFGVGHRLVGCQQADEDLQDLELNLDALRDDAFERVEDLSHKGLLARADSEVSRTPRVTLRTGDGSLSVRRWP